MGNEFKRRIVDWDEEDVHTGWRKMLCYTANSKTKAVKKIKRNTRRRERRELKKELSNAE